MHGGHGLLAILASLAFAVGCGDDGGGGGGDVTYPGPPADVYGVMAYGTEVGINWSPVPSANGYNVYESADGAVYTKVTPTLTPYYAYVTGNTSTDYWYYVTSVGGYIESAPSDVVWATPSSHSATLVCHQHGQTGVSRTPTFTWDPVPGAVTYLVVVMDDAKVNMIWSLRTLSAVTSVDFAGTSGTSVSPATENPLLPNTTYSLFIAALNTFNWGNVDKMGSFTTGP